MRSDTPPAERVSEQRCRTMRHVQPSAPGQLSRAGDDVCYQKGIWKPQTYPESGRKIQKTRLFRQSEDTTIRCPSGTVPELLQGFTGWLMILVAGQVQRLCSYNVYNIQLFWAFFEVFLQEQSEPYFDLLACRGVKLSDDRCIFILLWKLGDHVLSWFCCWFGFFYLTQLLSVLYFLFSHFCYFKL